MPRTTLLPLVALAGCQIFGGSRAELERLRKEKLEKPVFAMAPWRTDFDEARARAATEGKLILAYFTRSYAA